MSDQLPPPRRHRRNDATLPPTMKPGRENAEVFALQHGLFAAQVTMLHEDPAAFQEMRSALLTDYRPANHIELMMAEEVAAHAPGPQHGDRITRQQGPGHCQADESRLGGPPPQHQLRRR